MAKGIAQEEAATLERSATFVQSVNYMSSGVVLRLTPQLFDGISRMAISQPISSFAQTTTGVSGSPTLIKRNIPTVVGVSDSDVQVLLILQAERI